MMALGVIAGCSSPPPAPAAVPPPAASTAAVPAPTVSATASAEVIAKPPEAPPADEGPSLPPPAVAALHARTAKPGDGAWTVLVEGTPGKPALLYRTTVHPHPIKGHVYVTLVAIDLRRVDVRLIAGTDEPLSKTVPKEKRPGLIPAEDQGDLIAVMNGGFMAKHGGYGMRIGGDVFLPPKDDACTIALSKDGAMRIGTWTELAANDANVAAYRQTPPCLVEKGAVNAALEGSDKPRRWGLAENGDVEVRRSSLGLDATGKTLFYGLGEWVSPKLLADAMKAAGAVNAAQTDINWSYTRFLLYRRPRPDAPPEVASTLIPKIKHATGEYVQKPANRDFFYLKKQH